jgi:hypothetical protein
MPDSFAPSFPPLAAMGGSPIYFTGEESLKLSVQNAAAGVTVTITGRFLALGETRASPFKETLTPATDRTVSSKVIPLTSGWLLGVQAIVSAGSPLVGQTFARLSLMHGNTSAAEELLTLAADCITTKQPLAYPGSGILHSTDGAGALRSVTGSTPAVGAEISEAVPTGARWKVIAIGTVLTTSAAAGNRTPNILLDDGTNYLFQQSVGANVTASQAQKLSWAPGVVISLGVTPNGMSANIPAEMMLGAAGRVRTLTNGILAGDQWSAPQILVCEWIEGN